MGCMSNAWILLGHCTLIPYQFNGIVLVQRYFVVIADSMHCIRIEIRGGGGGTMLSYHRKRIQMI